MDGQEVLVYGYPKRNELDYMQGDAVENYWGTCALTAIANVLTQTGEPTSESQVVNMAISNNWTVRAQQRGILKSRRWRDGERRRVAAAGNDAVFEMRRKG